VFNERYKQFRKPMAARGAELDETDEVTDWTDVVKRDESEWCWVVRWW
jgi:hypothetical protein